MDFNEDTFFKIAEDISCLLYTSDAADDLLCVDLGGRRIIKKKKKKTTKKKKQKRRIRENPRKNVKHASGSIK